MATLLRIALLGFMTLILGCGHAVSELPTFAAAASLRHAVPELLHAWGREATVTYGGSGTLRGQVEAGAPIDAVLFASAAPVDALVAAGLADPTTRVRVATNQLVLVGPEESDPLTWETLPSLSPDQKLALGNPSTVPAGNYTKVALQSLGTWDALQDRIVFGGDVTMVLTYARRGEVTAAAVYATDAQSIGDVLVHDVADWDGAPSPEVVGAATSEATAGRDFLAFLSTPTAAEVFARHGFGRP